MDRHKLRDQIIAQVVSQIVDSSLVTSGYASHFVRRHGGIFRVRDTYEQHGEPWLRAAVDDMLREIDNILLGFQNKERFAC